MLNTDVFQGSYDGMDLMMTKNCVALCWGSKKLKSMKKKINDYNVKLFKCLTTKDCNSEYNVVLILLFFFYY